MRPFWRFRCEPKPGIQRGRNRSDKKARKTLRHEDPKAQKT